jgi:pimeloyl-ACP methyl ester carboxylesterase
MASVAVKEDNRSSPDSWLNAISKQTVSTDFGEIVVRVGGNKQRPVMVFWPSLLLDASMWKHQFKHYAPHYRIVLIDPPGVGEVRSTATANQRRRICHVPPTNPRRSPDRSMYRRWK